MRRPIAVLGFLVAGCAALNPAFDPNADDDGQSGTGSGGMMATSGPASSTGGGSTSNDDASAGGTSSDDGGSSSTVTGVSTKPDDWWDPAYELRLALEFDPRPGDLQDFVAWVPITVPDVFGGVDIEQLAFVDAITEERVAAEVRVFDAEGGRLEAWVNVPHWDPDEVTTIYLYFGDAAPPTAQENPWGRYAAVWHMDDQGAATLADSAAGHDAQPVPPAGLPAIVPGKVGNALELDGMQERYRALLDGTPPESQFLVSGWVRADAFPIEGGLLVSRGGFIGPDNLDTEWSFSLLPDVMRARVHNDANDMTIPPTVQVSSLGVGAWHHYAMLFTGTELVVFTDGNRRLSAPAVLDGYDHMLDVVSIGGYAFQDGLAWQDRLVDGLVDELRWRTGGEATNEWVALLHENQDDPMAALTVGPVESVSD